MLTGADLILQPDCFYADTPPVAVVPAMLPGKVVPAREITPLRWALNWLPVAAPI